MIIVGLLHCFLFSYFKLLSEIENENNRCHIHLRFVNLLDRKKLTKVNRLTKVFAEIVVEMNPKCAMYEFNNSV